MTKTFFISDTHFGHANTWYRFKNEDGTPMRNFSSTAEMDETMVTNWNSVVSPKDRVYHVGDFCIARRDLKFWHRLNGRICLVTGNHDIWKLSDYRDFQNIDRIHGVVQLPALGWIVCHVPVHERQLQGRWTHNIHGHLHANRVKDNFGIIDKRYFNVSVEQLNYTPIELEELKEILND